MRCHYCGSHQVYCRDSRATRDGFERRRRYECGDCGKRFSTIEMLKEKSTEWLIKKMLDLLDQAQRYVKAIDGGDGE